MFIPEAVNEVISHFLTEFHADQKACKTDIYIRDFLARRYNPEYAEEITQKYFKKICDILIDEYDYRSTSKELLRFRFLDDSGLKVVGIGTSHQKRLCTFQDALNQLSDSDFESLSATILKFLGCDQVWVTPLSHDQGLDSFGYANPFPMDVPPEIVGQSKIVYLAQAKHYNKHKVGSKDIREFIGSVELAVYKIYSKMDQKYINLSIPPFGPTTLVFVTTEELPRTVKTIARNAGIIVLAAQDIANLFLRKKVVVVKRWEQNSLVKSLRKMIVGHNMAK